MNDIMTVSAKGQITIPVDVRVKFEIKPGDKLIGEVSENGFVLKKPLDFFSLKGRLSGSCPDNEEDLLTPEVGRQIMERT